MVHQPRRVGAVFDECLEHPVVHRAGTLGLNRAQNGKTRKLVAKTDRVGLHLKQAASAGFIDCRLAWAQNFFDQPGFGPAR